jgi:hypothetical protein
MLPEETESATIEIGAYSLASKYLLNPSTEYATLNVNIANYATDILTIEVDWEKDVVINSNEPYHEDYTYIEHASSNVDLDFYVFDSEGNSVGGAGTGDCPEIIEIDETTLANGIYTVESFLYLNYFCDWDIYEEPETVQHTDLPQTSTFYQQGVFTDIVVDQDPAEYVNTADFDYYYYGQVQFNVAAMFEYTDGVVTVLDYNGDELGGAKAFDPTQIKKESTIEAR